MAQASHKHGDRTPSANSSVPSSVHEEAVGEHSRTNSASSMQAKRLAVETYPTEDQKAVFQRRLWRYLFKNVNRAVDELYNLCEDDSNLPRAKEAMALLQRCANDFEKLVDRIERQDEFARTPTRGLGWEVRKTNLGKPADLVRVKVERFEDLPCCSDNDNGNESGKESGNESGGEGPHQHIEIHSGDDTPLLRAVDTSPPVTRPKSLTLQFLETGTSPDGTEAEGDVNIIIPSTVSSGEFTEGFPSSHRLQGRDSRHNRHVSSTSSLFSALSGDDDDAVRFAEGSDAIWAQAEAYVEAEAQAEEDAWLRLLEMGHQGGDFQQLPSHPGTASTQRSHAPSTFPMSPYSTESMYSPASSTASAYRSLHEKLMSPERRKLTPVEAKKRHEERQQAAEQNRERHELERLEKARQTASRVKDVEQRKAQRLAQAEQQMVERLSLAGKRHDEYIRSIRGKAGNENIKVNEVLFINNLNKEAVQVDLQEQLTELEARIQAGRVRRQQRLLGIAATQRGRHQSKVKQMSQRQLEQEERNMERWNKLSARIEAVTQRREQRLLELQKQHELSIQQQQSAKERRDAVQQEVVAKAQLREQRRVEAAARRAAAKAQPSGSPITDTTTNAQAEKKGDSSQPRSAPIDDLDVGRQAKAPRVWQDALPALTQAISRKAAKKARDAFFAERPAARPSTSTSDDPTLRRLAQHVAGLQKVLEETNLSPTSLTENRTSQNGGDAADSSSVSTATTTNTAKKKQKNKKTQRKNAAVVSLTSDGFAFAAAVSSAAAPLLAALEAAPAHLVQNYLRVDGVLDVLTQLMEPAERLHDWYGTPTTVQLLKVMTKLAHQPSARDEIIGHPIALSVFHAFIFYSRAASFWWRQWLSSIEAQEQAHGKGVKLHSKQTTDQLPPCLECASELIALMSLLVRHVPGESCTTYQAFIWYLHSAGVIQALLNTLRKTHEHTTRLLDNATLRTAVGRAYALLEAASTVLASHSHSTDAPVKSLQQLRGRGCSFQRAAEIFVNLKESGFASNILNSVGSLFMEENPNKHGDRYHLNPFVVDLTTVALRALNNLALSDLRVAQDLSVEDIQITLFHLVDRMLAVMTPLLGNRRSNSGTEECLRQLIVYLGYLSLGQPAIQERLSYGRPPTVLVRLCALPMRFFSDSNDKAILLPTLIAAVYGNDVNKKILFDELSPTLLISYLEKHLQALEKCTTDKEPLPADTRALSLRLPAGMWAEIIKFLQMPVNLETSSSEER